MKPPDKVKTGYTLDTQGFLAHFNNSEDAKKVVKAFEDSRILRFMTFNYKSVHKEEVLEFYLNARMIEERKVVSKVASMNFEVIAKSIRAAFEFPPAIEAVVRSHAYNEKDLWATIKNSSNSAEDMPVKGKKKDLLSPLKEHLLDIIYKCLESRVAVMDYVNAEKFILMHAILSSSKYDWAKYVFECLEYYINKAAVTEGDKELEVNVGYGFMISHMLKLQDVPLGKGSEEHPNAYMFNLPKSPRLVLL